MLTGNSLNNKIENNDKNRKYYLVVEDKTQDGGNFLHKIFPPMGNVGMPLYNSPYHNPPTHNEEPSVLPIPMLASAPIGMPLMGSRGMSSNGPIGMSPMGPLGMSPMGPIGVEPGRAVAISRGSVPFFPRTKDFTPGVIDVRVPGAVSLGDDTSVIVGPPIFHFPVHMGDAVTALNIYSDQYRFSIEFPYKLMRSILDDIYKESAKNGNRDVRITLATANRSIHRTILTSDKAVLDFIGKIGTKYLTRPSFRDKTGKVVKLNDLTKALQKRIKTTSGDKDDEYVAL